MQQRLKNNMDYFKEHRTGLIGTLIIHGLILLLLLFFGFITPMPLPVEEGILVNFGDMETGFGLEEPAPGEAAVLKNKVESQVPSNVVPPPTPAQKVASPVDKEELLTQDYEKTVALESTKKKEKAKKETEEDKLLKEKRRQEQLDKQKAAEEERVRQAEITRQKKAEEQQLALAAEQQRKAGEINSRAKNAFGGNGKGNADSKSTSQGVTFGPGNQGSPNGSANVDKYGPGAGTGNGPSFSLDGRNGLSLPKPYYPGNEEGIVVVQVTVDKNGLVTKAEAGAKGSNTANPELVAAAKKAAMQAKFNADANAPAFQVGTITYRFVLD